MSEDYERAEVSWLLRVAENVQGDPQVDDLGPLFAAVCRHQARAMDRDVYQSLLLKASALLHTLVRTPALEHSNQMFAWMVAAAFLDVNGYELSYSPKDAATLVADVEAGRAGVQQIARQLRRWRA
ncbi:fic family toxin-antitoxin system, toxin component [Actinacidiphila rubida]|uniref:Death on curing protein n=1 Tax=Actinacidiphila rubida TaxID=310780 RepID=A0A1H8U508_9ACTN|nr:fic family toxin-antitoxin system, toxin component [Actinacidiphila rubida]SEO98261.1 death on curing protein [Actinacidiphila rubida]